MNTDIAVTLTSGTINGFAAGWVSIDGNLGAGESIALHATGTSASQANTVNITTSVETFNVVNFNENGSSAITVNSPNPTVIYTDSNIGSAGGAAAYKPQVAAGTSTYQWTLTGITPPHADYRRIDAAAFAVVVAPDTTEPTVSTLRPADGDTVATTNTLTMTFNEAIATNTTGSITITNLAGGAAQVISIGDTSRVAVSTTNLTITPSPALAGDASYAVLIDTNAVKDLSGNFFAGFTNTVAWDWNFTLVEPGPPTSTTAGGATSIGIGTATLRGLITEDWGETLDHVRIYFGDEDGGESTTGWDTNYVFTGSVTEGVTFSTNLTGLLYGIEYSYRVYASNGNGAAWSAVTNFTTLSPEIAGDSGRIAYADMTITSSSDYSNRDDDDAFNGNGLIGDNHNNTANDMWLTDTGDGVANSWLKIGLGGTYNLDYLRIWNYNETATATTKKRGINQCDIFIADSDPGNNVNGSMADFNATGWTLLHENAIFANAAQLVSVTNSTPRFELGGASAAFLAIRIDSNHGGDAYVGLSEMHIHWAEPGVTIGITNTPAANITATTADLLGSLDATQSVFTVYAYWSTNDNASSAVWLADTSASNAVVGTYTNVTDQALSNHVSSLTPDTTYYYTFMATNAATNMWADSNASFETEIPDTTSPAIAGGGLSPADGVTGVTPSANLVATFTENIALTGSGTITITNLDTSATVVISLDALPDADGSVSVTDNELTINLAADLAFGTEYAVLISDDAIVDTAASPNAFAGILDDATWNFQTELPDTTPPAIAVGGLNPADGTTDVAVGVTLVGTFNEPIALKAGGTITITDLTDGSSTVVITLPAVGQVSVSGTDLTINPTLDLDFDTHYSVKISAAAVEDLPSPTPNSFAGILNDTTWDFTTVKDLPAYGGSETVTYGDWVAWIFREDGTLTVTETIKVEYLIVGGGGGGGSRYFSRTGGGGGAGGVLTGTGVLTAGDYVITVGGGGNGCTSVSGNNGQNGGNSSIETIGIATGGGRGGNNGGNGANGGSGGGGSGHSSVNSGGTGVAGQGVAGGGCDDSVTTHAGGGGGEGGVGQNGSTGGTGGPGVDSSISGTTVTYAEGGHGGTSTSTPTNGSPNTGSGGDGGGSTSGPGGNGGSGIVVIRCRLSPEPTVFRFR